MADSRWDRSLHPLDGKRISNLLVGRACHEAKARETQNHVARTVAEYLMSAPKDFGHSQELLAFIDGKLHGWRKICQELVRIPSFFENEHEITNLVEYRIQEIGAKPIPVNHDPRHLRRLRAAQPPISEVPGRRSLVARVPGTGRGRSLIIVSHLDVVPPGDPLHWTYPPFSGHIDEQKGIIYGRGAMDDKAGVTICLALLETLLQTPLRLAGDIIFHFILEDETTGNGSLLCLEAGHRGDAALIIDGTRPDKAVNEHAGQMQFGIVVKGQPAHLCVSHLGINAAEVMAHLLLRLKKAVSALNEERVNPWTQFPSPFQVVVQKMYSKGLQMTVPEIAESQCYMTFPPPFTLEKAKQFLRQQLEMFAAEQSLPSVPELHWSGFAVEPVASDSMKLEEIMRSTAARLGMPPIEKSPSTGSSDMRHYCDAGIPCLLYGPGTGFNPHRIDEHYYLYDLPKMIHFYLEMMYSWTEQKVTK